MSFQDIIKNSILETMENNTLSTASICITLGIAILFCIYIYAVYYLSQKKSFYNKQFNIVLGVLPIITAGIILAMQSNLVISLGMVGALSIVRFRTAVKEPKDMLFLFWSIGIGIILGARNYELALLISIVVTSSFSFSSWFRKAAQAFFWWSTWTGKAGRTSLCLPCRS